MTSLSRKGHFVLHCLAERAATPRELAEAVLRRAGRVPTGKQIRAAEADLLQLVQVGLVKREGKKFSLTPEGRGVVVS